MNTCPRNEKICQNAKNMKKCVKNAKMRTKLTNLKNFKEYDKKRQIFQQNKKSEENKQI